MTTTKLSYNRFYSNLANDYMKTLQKYLQTGLSMNITTDSHIEEYETIKDDLTILTGLDKLKLLCEHAELFEFIGWKVSLKDRDMEYLTYLSENLRDFKEFDSLTFKNYYETNVKTCKMIEMEW